MTTEIQTSWMTPIKQFLENGDYDAQQEKTMQQ